MLPEKQSEIRGKILKDVPLGEQSWFRCGGTADMVFQPADVEDLQNFLAQNDLPITVVGGLANTIVRDGGIRGVVIQPARDFAAIEVLDDTTLKVQAGALNGSVAAAALKNGIGGLEFLSGIPGSMGGAMAMNAGAYGNEMKDVLVSCEILNFDGTIETKTPEQLDMTYRHTNISDQIVISATVRGVAEDYDTVKARLIEIKKKRNATQPIKEQTGGSTFANPDAADLRAAGLPEDMRAWQVVDKVGARDLIIGGATMSDMHGNFMVNLGDAKAADLEALGDEIIARAQEQLGLKLRWEIKRIGER